MKRAPLVSGANKVVPVTRAFQELRAGLARAERGIMAAHDVGDILRIDQQLAALREVVAAVGLGAAADFDVFVQRMRAKRKGGELLGEPPGHGPGRPEKGDTVSPFPKALNKAERHRWRLLRWAIPQPEWDTLTERMRGGLMDGGGLRCKWTQTEYLRHAKEWVRNQRRAG